MAPFEYRPYDSSRWTGSIADIIRLKGQIPAEAAIRTGQINADAARASGAAWAGAASDIGRSVAGTLQQMNDPRRQLEGIQLKNAQDQQAGQQRFDQLVKPYQPNGPQDQGAGPAPAQTPYLDEKGLFKIPELSQALAASGMAHMAPDLLKGAEAINGSILQHQATQQKLAINETVMYGDIADGVTKMTKAGIPITQALDFAAAPGLATKRFDPQTFAQFKGKLLSMAPEQQTAVLAGLMDAASKASGNKTLGKDAQEVDRYGRVVASNVVAEPNKGDYTGPDGIRYHADGSKVTGAVMTPQHVPVPKSLQMKSVLVDGKPTEASYNPTDGSWQVGGAPVEAARVKPIPPASTTVNLTSATDAKSIADAIVAGDQPPDVKGLYRLAGPVRAELAKQGYDMTKANLDWEATKKHLSTLNGAQQTRLRQAISTASDSLGVIEDLAKQWDGGKFPVLNRAALTAAVNGAMGPKAQQIATNLTAQITDVTSELGNVYMGGNSPTDHALSLAGKNLSADWTRDQLLNAIKLARTNLQIRNNSIVNSGAITSSNTGSQTTPLSTPTPTAPMRQAIPGHPGKFAVSADGGKTWKAE